MSKKYFYPKTYKFDLRICEKCKCEFRPLKASQDRCSLECSKDVRNCINCNSIYSYYYKTVDRIFCSKKCSGEFERKNRIIGNCLNCNENISILPCNVNKTKYCSRKCKDEHQKILFAGIGNPNFDKHSLKGHVWSDERNESVRQGVIKSWKSPQRLEKTLIALNAYKEKFGFLPGHSDESQQKRKETIYKKILNNEWNTGKKYYHGYYFSIKTGIEEYYQSSWEMIRMMELDVDDSVKFWTKKHKIIINLNDKNVYLPDFMIEYFSGITIIEEVKGFIRNPELYNLKCKKAKEYVESSNIFSDYIVNFMNHLRKCPKK